MSLFQSIASTTFSFWDQLDLDEKTMAETCYGKYDGIRGEKKKIKEILRQQEQLLGGCGVAAKNFKTYSENTLHHYKTEMYLAIKEFFDFMNEKYSLLEWIKEKKLDIGSPKDICECYFRQSGLKSLREESIKKTTKDFKRHIKKHNGEKIKVHPNCVELTSYFYIRNNGYFDNSANEDADLLKRILLILEFGSTIHRDEAFDAKFDIEGRQPIPTEETLFGAQKTHSVKFYKNGNIKIKFKEPQYQEEFLKIIQ